MNKKRRILFAIVGFVLSINTLPIDAVTMYREKLTYPEGWYDEMSLPYREMKFGPFYLEENLYEIEVESNIDKARQWGYKTIEEYDDSDVITLYATEKSVTIPKFLKEDYLNVGWHEKLITLYAPDGRTLDVTPDDKHVYLNLGWYEKPVTTLYTLDGRQHVFYNEELDAQCNVGWYREKPVLLYTLDGRKEFFHVNQVEAQLSVGWYRMPPVTLYTLDGRSKVFPAEAADEQRHVGWYYKSEIDKIHQQQLLAKSFYIGQKVWKKGTAYIPVGYVTSIDNGNIFVSWEYFYDWNSYRIYNQQDILYAERFTGITLGQIYCYPADTINVYK